MSIWGYTIQFLLGIFTINELGNALLTSQCKGILVGYSWDMNRNGDIQYWDIIWSVITHTHSVTASWKIFELAMEVLLLGKSSRCMFDERRVTTFRDNI